MLRSDSVLFMFEFKIRLPTSKLVFVDVRFIDLEAVSWDGFLSFNLRRIYQDFLLIFRRLHVILKELLFRGLGSITVLFEFTIGLKLVIGLEKAESLF